MRRATFLAVLALIAASRPKGYAEVCALKGGWRAGEAANYPVELKENK